MSNCGSNECLDSSCDDLILVDFARRFPLIHHREQLWVDPYLTDSLANEAEMSIKRRIYNPSLTSTSFEDRMYWEMVVLPPLRLAGREAGKIQREASKAGRDANIFGPINKAVEIKSSDWCDTYNQCHAVSSSLVDDWLPRLGSDAFKSAPAIRADLKVSQGLVKEDRKLAEGWCDALEESSKNFKRDLSYMEIVDCASNVKLHHQLSAPKNEYVIPLRSRLELPYRNVPAVSLQAELQCLLPLSLLAMKQLQGGLTSSLRLILAALLPPHVFDDAAIKAIQLASENHNSCLLADEALVRTPRSLFPLLIQLEVLLVVKRCVRTGLIKDGDTILSDVDVNKFCALLENVSPEKVRTLHAYVIRVRALAKATKMPLCFKENESLLKGNAMKALTKFSDNAIKILQYIGSFHDNQINLGVDVVMDTRLDEDAPTTPRYLAGAGSGMAMFILGPLAMSPDNRKSIGCFVKDKDSVTVLRLPKHGEAGFVSFFHDNTAADDEIVFD